MKRFLFCLILAFFTFLCISCNLQIEERTSTSLLIPASVFKAVSDSPQTTAPQTRLNVYLTCGKESITERHILTKEELNNGLRLKFDNLPVGNTGHLYVEFANIKCNGIQSQEENTNFYANDVAIHLGETSFEVIPNGEVYIKLELKPAKKYKAKFNFIGEDSEDSNVELDFTERSTIKTNLPVGTTKWTIKNEDNLYFGRFGEQIYAKELLNYFQNKNANFILKPTGELPEKIKTPIVYCEKDPNAPEVSYTYKILGSNTSVLTTSAEITDYCFDNAGNFYFIDDYCPVYKIAYNHKENKYEDFTNQGSFYNAASSSQITYDKAQNYLYIYGSKRTTDSDPTYIHRIQNPAGAIYKNKIYEEDGTLEHFLFTDPLRETDIDIFGSISFTVHNGILYVSKIQRTAEDADGMKNSYLLVLQKGSIETGPFEEPIEYKILSNAQYGLSGTTDIMFQDGSLYVIFRCYNDTGWNINNNYSTGGIVKYNIESNSFYESFGIKGFAPNNSKKIIATEERNISFYAPTNETESTSFYGPTKFVAIMPKKLVFLDQGASIDDYAYNPNNPNNNNIPTKSRIVEYDLSTNTFTSKEINGNDLHISFAFTM